MAYQVIEQIEALVDAFLSRRLPKSEWTHDAHLTVALWHVWTHPEEEAQVRISHAIKKYNEAVGTPNTEISGYHETITCFWMKVAASYKNKNPDLPLLPLCNAFLASKYADKTLPLAYLPIELLMSPKARLALDVRIFKDAWEELFKEDQGTKKRMG